MNPLGSRVFLPMAHSELWRRDQCLGHEYWIFEPRKVHPREYSILYLHDQGESLPGALQFVEPLLEEAGVRLAAPWGADSWWLEHSVSTFDTRFTPRHFLGEILVPRLREEWGLPERRLGVCGVGVGGQGALLLSYRYPRVLPVVAAVAPAIDFHLRVPHEDILLTEVFGDREWARQHTAILHVHPLNYPPHQFFCCDPEDYEWFDSSDRLRMKLGSIGIPFQADLETSEGGDRGSYVRRMWGTMLDFMVQALERERLRVL